MNEREIFAEALLRADQVERAAYLERVCAGDGALRQRLGRLLDLHESDRVLLERGTAELLEALSEPGDSLDGCTDPGALAASLAQLAVFLAPATRPDAHGRIGHYEVLEVLGQGGFGIVVKAFDDTLHRIVAIKFLAPSLAVTSPPRKRFLREARAAAQVRHEHVVQIYAVEEQPIPYLVMEFVEGQTLQQRLDATGPLEPAEVVRLGQQIALGLAAAHDKGLIHRDVKPANILVEAGVEVRVKLTDFGLARTGDDASMSQSGVVAGTPMFMAPEQARGGQLDARTDLFSLGSVLYAMVSGRPPFRAPNTLAVLKRVVEDNPRPLPQVIDDVPAGLCAVIERLHEKNPTDRFGSARETSEALARCLTEPVPRWRRRSPLKVAAAVLTVLVLIGGMVWGVAAFAGLLHQSEDTRQETKTQDNSGAQVAAVVARLKQLNPQFDEKSVSHRSENGVVVALRIRNCANLNDLTPLRALTGLTDLRLSGRGAADLSPLQGMKLVVLETNGPPIKDLSPLAGMPLHSLNLWGFVTDDLSPLQGMKLVNANFGGSPVRDISVLKGMPLELLCLNFSRIDDLSPLAGAPLRRLECENTQVTDISPLANSPLEELWLRGSPIADYTPLARLPLKHLSLNYQPALHAQLLRSISTLETVNKKPIAELLGNDGK